jgi:uncharacterized protein (TIGR00255 family)
MKSMTAFARADQKLSYGTISWELRSVNHRYLEVYFRMPDDLRALELPARELIAKKLARGKVECVLNYKPDTASAQAIKVNLGLVKQLHHASREIASQMSVAPSTITDILRWPGVVETAGPDQSSMVADAIRVLGLALDDLIAARTREGEKLKLALEERRQAVAAIVVKVRARMGEVQANVRARIIKRLEELAVAVDQNRLEQELVFLLQRSDVEEELKRLETHVDEIYRILFKPQEPTAGRRLDFLMQELNREANTLCSKSMDIETTQAGIDLKVNIEQMREQVQNIE